MRSHSIRYCTEQMRFHTWRKLWLNLAIAEKELGLPISDQAIEEMKANLVGTSSYTMGILADNPYNDIHSI